MKIAIDINSVIRDTFSKASQIYQRYYLEETENEKTSTYDEDTGKWVEDKKEEGFKYSLNLPITGLNLNKHFVFKEESDLYNFFYQDFTMQIFGHAPSTDNNTFNIINDIYINLRDNHDLYLISDEMGKSKPATLFFLSKYGCLYENIIFYSKTTFDKVLDNFDLIITANPEIIKNKKNVIKYSTTYNSNILCENTIEDIEELEETLNNLIY